jgi:hypothetical protein
LHSNDDDFIRVNNGLKEAAILIGWCCWAKVLDREDGWLGLREEKGGKKGGILFSVLDSSDDWTGSLEPAPETDHPDSFLVGVASFEERVLYPFL